jgi:hypothetical protein
MAVEPPPDFREEVDIVRIDPLFLERQRNRYASRGVESSYCGVARSYCSAISVRLSPQIENAPKVGDAMVVFELSLRLLRACSLPTSGAQIRAPERVLPLPMAGGVPACCGKCRCSVAGPRRVGTAVALSPVSSSAAYKSR